MFGARVLSEPPICDNRQRMILCDGPAGESTRENIESTKRSSRDDAITVVVPSLARVERTAKSYRQILTMRS